MGGGAPNNMPDVTLPLWLLILLMVVPVLVTLFFTLLVRDAGSMILALPQEAGAVVWKDILEALKSAVRRSPFMNGSTAAVKRAIYFSGFILNTSSSDVLTKLSGVRSAFAFPVKNPAQVATTFSRILKGKKLDTLVVHDFDAEVPAGLMTAVVFPQFNWAIIFRVHKFKMKPTPKKWSWSKV